MVLLIRKADECSVGITFSAKNAQRKSTKTLTWHVFKITPRFTQPVYYNTTPICNFGIVKQLSNHDKSINMYQLDSAQQIYRC